MPHPLHAFIVAAQDKGADDAFIARLLREAGWPDDQISDAFLQHYVGLTGVAVPAPLASTRVSARDAFYYLVSFLTLGIWATALGSLIFSLINNAYPRTPFGEYSSYDSFSSEIAAIVIALPIYLLLTRGINRDLALHPAKAESGVRRWLTFIILFVTASIVIGDLIVFLTGLLDGETPAGFLLKVVTVLLIAGGIFLYYFWDMRRRVAAHPVVTKDA